MLATASAGSRQQVTAARIAVSGAEMPRKKRRARRGTTTFATDEQMIAYLAEHSPEVLERRVSEDELASAVGCLLKQPPQGGGITHFYCRKCGEYHLKTHPHHAEMIERKRKNAK